MAAVAKYGPDSLTDAAGNIVTDAQINVYESDGVTAATVYSDRALTSVITQPFTPDSGGNVEFYVAGNGEYIVVVTRDGAEVGRFDVELTSGAADSAQVGLSNDQVAAWGSFRVVQYSVVDHDDIGEWDATNHRLNSNGGVYNICPVVATALDNLQEVQIHLYKNGVDFLRLSHTVMTGGETSPVDVTVPGAANVKLASGDYLDIRVFSWSDLTLYGSFTNLTIAKIG